MKTLARSFTFLLTLVFFATTPVRGTAITGTPATSSRPAAVVLLQDRFSGILQRHVKGTRVDYLAWASNWDDLHGLGEVIDGLSKLDPSDWPEADAVAYWIDLYNALTVKLILDNYPLSSIKDLGGFLKSGPWSRDLVEIAGQSLTLNQIENEKLRPRTRDARIHFAINCASLGCPPLRNEAYTASHLASQLEAATTSVLHDERWLKIEDETVFLSKLFDWYREDFVEDAGSLESFLARYRDDLPSGDYKIEFMDYSWRLNDLEEKES